MSQENQSEEIDLMQLFGMIKGFFRRFLGLFVDIVLFFKKKVVLFLILSLIGGGLGFFMDQYKGKKDSLIQEITIEPKYQSVEYIYDFVEDLEDNLKDENYVESLGLQVAEVENIKMIELEPIINPEDVLNKIQDTESFTEDYNDKILKERKYRNFYKQHKLSIVFDEKNESNRKITDVILKYLKSNPHYNKVVNLQLKLTKNNLEQNKRSLTFVNDYLTNLSENPGAEDSKFIFATETETPTIASLLKRKEELILQISNQERSLELSKEVYTVVENTGVIARRKKLSGRMMFTLPLILVGLVSGVYFLGYLSKSVISFVNEE
ncbi:hypothetical protein U6A24_19940 [Aquimarina gracilis]|uniref:Subunit length determinant protein n=1 Tax=Aquimarina gracilis TaxID=874422 RepID=A0ABU6A0W6_9FLAO|nr:hypothetical protein [Aquimarina gracilis]MEB3347759.1 hypothetical protein [Aquimarina gracilis]